MLSPHAEKWGDASPRPPPIDARGSKNGIQLFTVGFFFNTGDTDRRSSAVLFQVVQWLFKLVDVAAKVFCRVGRSVDLLISGFF